MNNASQVGHSIVRQVLKSLVAELDANNMRDAADFVQRHELNSVGQMAEIVSHRALPIHGLTVSRPLGGKAARQQVNEALLQLDNDVKWAVKFGRMRELCERIMYNVKTLIEERHIINVTSAITSNFARMLDAFGVFVGDDKLHDELTEYIYGTLKAAIHRPQEPETVVADSPWINTAEQA